MPCISGMYAVELGVASHAHLMPSFKTVSGHMVSKQTPENSNYLSRTVWLYLFFLPFQLVAEFSWYTIPGVAIASFIYLGFLAAGDEIGQPFGMIFICLSTGRRTHMRPWDRI